MLRDHIKEDIFLFFQASGCLLLHESSAELSALLSLSNYHLSIAISMSSEWMVAYNRFNGTLLISSNVFCILTAYLRQPVRKESICKV